MTDAINEVRTLIGPIDPALGCPVPVLHSEAILRSILQGTPGGNPPAVDRADSLPADARDPMPPRRFRRRGLASCVAALLVVIGVVATLRVNGSSDRTGRVVVGGRPTVARPEAPLVETSPDAARLLPAPGARIDQLVSYTTPVDSTYQQLYLGTRTEDPPQLFVATIDAAQHRSGSLLLSESLAGNHHPVRLGSLRANISSAPNRTYLWWTQSHGVEVDVTATYLPAPEVLRALSRAPASMTSRLGLDIHGPLPAGLRLLSTAATTQPRTNLENVDYHQGTCAAHLGVFSGVGAQVENAAGTTRITTIDGHPALLSTTDKTGTLVWTPFPGITARLSASSAPGACGVTTLAQQVHLVTSGQWEATVTQLGDKAHHVPTSPRFH